MSHKRYIPSAYDANEPLLYRANRAGAQISNIVNRMNEASAGHNYVAAEQYALELLRAAELNIQYFQQFTRVETVSSVVLGKKLGTWNPHDGVNLLFPPNSYKEGDYFEATEGYGDFDPQDLLVAQGERWIRFPNHTPV